MVLNLKRLKRKPEKMEISAAFFQVFLMLLSSFQLTAFFSFQ